MARAHVAERGAHKVARLLRGGGRVVGPFVRAAAVKDQTLAPASRGLSAWARGELWRVFVRGWIVSWTPPVSSRAIQASLGLYQARAFPLVGPRPVMASPLCETSCLLDVFRFSNVFVYVDLYACGLGLRPRQPQSGALRAFLVLA